MAKIYYSATLTGQNPRFDLNRKLAGFMEEMGHQVLSEHIIYFDDLDYCDEVYKKNTGTDIAFLRQQDGLEFAHNIRKTDMDWVDEADYVVVLVSGASLGVGMEIERALLRPQRGLSVATIFVMVEAEYWDKCSNMVRGISEDFVKVVSVADEEQMLAEIESFLS